MSPVCLPRSVLRTGLLLLALLGCSCAGGRGDVAPATSEDSWEGFNRFSYNVTDAVDRTVVQPVARGYRDTLPSWTRTGVTNFFNNVSYLDVILNSFLQGKLDQGLSDTARFVFNSTIGVGGLVDVGGALGLPRHEEDFGQTLAVWGVAQGNYMFLPMAGPDTVRDLPGRGTRMLLSPFTYVGGIVMLPVGVINVVNERANLLEATRLRDESAVDPYVFTREAFLQRRRFLIYDGQPPLPDFDELDELDEEDGGGDGSLIIE